MKFITQQELKEALAPIKEAISKLTGQNETFFMPTRIKIKNDLPEPEKYLNPEFCKTISPEDTDTGHKKTKKDEVL